MNDEAEFQVMMEDGTFCTDTIGPRERALAEARHYAVQYAEDGPVRIEEITRIVIERIPERKANHDARKAGA